ncbi:MAG: trypsin-like peptidase domain-containing protein [Ignavibacteria bacterium]|nr:trypsin-like peptidase domain-containing protein [Ignavibacteria bacterium]
MKKIIIIIILLIFPYVSSYPQTVSDILEYALPSVVTVAIFKTEDASRMLGFVDEKMRGDNIDIAYEKILDLSGAKSTGSGFVIERNGEKYVITNAHVIDNASSDKGSIVAYTINRTKYDMELVGGDTFYDIAVLKFLDIPGPEINTIDFRNTEVRIGEQVYALGNPLGDYPYSVSDGIISGKNRIRKGIMGKFGFLQTTATIIWGNSGGPLIDINGEVVGINSQIEIVQKQFQSFIQPQINFALESSICNKLVNDIIDFGIVKRAYLGIEISKTKKIPSRKEKFLNYSLIITGIIEGSPADKSESLKNKIGYKITEINNIEVKNLQEVLCEFEKIIPGENVNLHINQNTDHENIEIKSEILKSDELEKIAYYALKDLGTFKIKSEEEGVYLEDPKYSREWKIMSAGIVFSKNNKFLWKIKNMFDLGAALRFSGPYGVLDCCLLKRGDYEGNAKIETLHLSGNENEYKYTIWY